MIAAFILVGLVVLPASAAAQEVEDDKSPPSVAIDPVGTLRNGVVIAPADLIVEGRAVDPSDVVLIELVMKRGTEFIRADGSVSRTAVVYEASLDPRQGTDVRWFQSFRLDPGGYQLLVTATDGEGNEGAAILRTFNVLDPTSAQATTTSTTQPSLGIATEPTGPTRAATPADGISATLSLSGDDLVVDRPSAIIGTASANRGVLAVGLIVRNLETGDLVDIEGAPTITTESIPVDLLAPAAEVTSWIGSLALPDGLYEVDVEVTDLDGAVARLARPIEFEMAEGETPRTTTTTTTTPRPTTTTSTIPAPTTTTTAPVVTRPTSPTTVTTAAPAVGESTTTVADDDADGDNDDQALLNQDDRSRWMVWLFVLALVAFVILTVLGFMVWLFARTRPTN